MLLTVSAVCRVASVFAVADKWMSDIGEMRTNLVSTSGLQLDFHQTFFSAFFLFAVFCENCTAVFLRFVKHADKAFIFVADKKMGKRR